MAGFASVHVSGIETRPDWERMAQTVRITANIGTLATLSPFWNPQTAPSEYHDAGVETGIEE